ncbi:hypothetical protein BJV74DRAFT_158561 [Russula compacta]|nr:hypothetical protein BJV74DRAFT_158561 [Russula compacta]
MRISVCVPFFPLSCASSPSFRSTPPWNSAPALSLHLVRTLASGEWLSAVCASPRASRLTYILIFQFLLLQGAPAARASNARCYFGGGQPAHKLWHQCVGVPSLAMKELGCQGHNGGETFSGGSVKAIRLERPGTVAVCGPRRRTWSAPVRYKGHGHPTRALSMGFGITCVDS